MNIPKIDQYANNYQGYGNDRHSYYAEDSSTPNTPRVLDDFQSASMLPAASAAATLAQLHNHKLENDWESENVCQIQSLRNKKILTMS
jgi:hypothetical protein